MTEPSGPAEETSETAKKKASTRRKPTQDRPATPAPIDVLFDGQHVDADGNAVELTRERREALMAILEDPEASSLNIGAAYFQYVNGLPKLAVSRDPHTGNAISMRIDTFGLDGPWWDRAGPARGRFDRPWTLTAMTGAMRLGAPLEHTAHVVMPGPDRPFVVPRLLQESGRAVVSQLAVGPHTAWLVLYFHLDPWNLGPRYNDWGDIWHHFVDANGEVQRVHVDERDEPIDLDLGRWIDVGRVLWIEPGDESLALREGRDGCPFLDLAGHGRTQVVQEGQVVTMPTLHVAPVTPGT